MDDSVLLCELVANCSPGVSDWIQLRSIARGSSAAATLSTRSTRSRRLYSIRQTQLAPNHEDLSSDARLLRRRSRGFRIRFRFAYGRQRALRSEIVQQPPNV